MALFAETLVEEWLNRQGYFTVRGAKGGQLEMDLLAVRYREDGGPDALHVEVQASTGAMGWICEWTPELRKELGVAPRNVRKRTEEQMSKCVQGWVFKKYLDPRVEKVRRALFGAAILGRISFQMWRMLGSEVLGVYWPLLGGLFSVSPGNVQQEE